MKSQNCQAEVVTWPLVVMRLPRPYQKKEAKVQPHHEWPPTTLPKQNSTKNPLPKIFILRRALFFRASDLRRGCLWAQLMNAQHFLEIAL